MTQGPRARSILRTAARGGLVALLLAPVLACASTRTDSGEGIPSLSPSVQTAEWAVSWWMPRHEQKLEDLKSSGPIDLVMIGDSITHGWEQTGSEVWDEFYGQRNAFNLGFGGDRTEQVLWRLDHGAVDGMTPRLVVLMIGTNNTGHRQDPAEETAAGVAAIVEDLQRRLPEARILLLAIFPRGATRDDPLRQLNAEVNERIVELADGERVVFLDLNDVFLGTDGTLSEEIMPDLLHPNERGYRLWAEAMEPTLDRLLSESGD